MDGAARPRDVLFALVTSPPPTSPCVEIDLDAIAANLRWVRSRLCLGVELHAVIKADAYGHGAPAVARTIAEHALADRLVVATLDEAAALPAPLFSPPLPVTVLRPIDLESGDAVDAAIEAGWQLTVGSAAAASSLAGRAARRGARVPVQVMLDTGLNRCGVEPAAFAEVARAVRSRPDALELRCVATHLATADAADASFAEEQLARFSAATDALVIDSAFRLTRSAAASGATLRFRHAQFDAVRIGAATYGISPFGQPDAAWPLRGAMRWVAPLLTLRTIAAGESVGYGRAWTAARPTRVATVPIGYHDGYPRAASNRGTVIVGDRPCPIIGRVSMDSILVDVTDAPSATVGTRVIVLDADPASPANMHALAAACDSTAYEIVARAGTRLPRRYSPVRPADASAPDVDHAACDRDPSTAGRQSRQHDHAHG